MNRNEGAPVFNMSNIDQHGGIRNFLFTKKIKQHSRNGLFAGSKRTMKRAQLMDLFLLHQTRACSKCAAFTLNGHFEVTFVG